MEATLPTWKSKKEAEKALKAARKHWEAVRKNGAEPGDEAYEAAKKACVTIEQVLRRM
jgi:hypothetical protein